VTRPPAGDEGLRRHFLLDPGTVFLNHGSFGACPAEVLQAQHVLQLEMERNPVEFLGRRSAARLGAARDRLAAFLAARPEDLVFVTNSTTAVNVVARSLDLGPGDEIVTTDHEYGACDATWEWVAGRAGARLVRAEIPLPFDRGSFADRLFAAVTRRTRLISLSHITSGTALVFPVAEVCRRARAAGIPTLVDGAHAPGQVELDLAALGADFYAGNCHKWLCAPKGAAFLWARPEHHARLDPPVVSWGLAGDFAAHPAIAAVTGTTELERRLLWQGTRDITPFLAVPAALAFLERIAWPALRTERHGLVVETRDRVDAVTGLEPIAPPDDLALMAAIALPECDGERLQLALRERHRIEVPVTGQGGRRFLRVACHAYTTRRDADALVAAASELLAPGR